ncbi:MAG: hypothetical protein ACI4LX_12245 [Treponema sp.]
MTEKRINRLFLFLLSAFCLCLPVFAEVTIVSPASAQSRIWANRQVLLINITDDEEVFYSFTGSDPLSSGFVYDEPVLLDVTGEVELKVTSIDKKKQRRDYILKYTVDESLAEKLSSLSLDEINFIQKMSSAPIFDLPCGTELVIPSSFEYSISSGDKKEPFETGRAISISAESNIERYFSLTIKSKENVFWNFTVHVIPMVQGEFTRVSLPFEFIEWSKIHFVDSNYIYSVDDGWWQGSGKTVELDRTVSHCVRWQNVNYDPANPIQTYTVPPIPVIRSEIQEDSSVVVTLEGDLSYRLSRSDKNQIATLPDGLYKTIVADAFQGENFSSVMPVDIYSENVFQGTLFACVQVNRQKPAMPEVVLDSKSSVSRSDVEFSIVPGGEEQKIKYYVSGPHKLSFDDVKNDFSEEIDIESFALYDGKKILLTAKDDEPALYRIYCYAIDKWDNTSSVRSVAVNIDKCNYFVDSKSNSRNPDGTYLNPFKDLSQMESIVNANRFSRFYVSGKVSIPDLKISLKQNSELIGLENSEIVFAKESSIYLINSSLNIKNLMINSVYASENLDSSLFTLENSVLTVENSEISFGRYKNASLFNCINSVLNLKSSGVTSFANDYSCAVSLNSSKLSVSDCRIATVGNTNVNFSCKNSKVELSGSSCSVSGFNSRIAELFQSSAKMTGNNFEAKDIQKKTKNVPVWKDENSVFTGTKNTFSGF